MSVKKMEILETPIPIPVKVEEDQKFFIDLDTKGNSPEDIVIEWHLEIKRFFGSNVGVLGETKLVNVMKDYIMTLTQRAVHFEEVEKLQTMVEKHIEQIYWLYHDLDICFSDTYLDNMEHIMTFYVNLTLRVLLTMKTKRKVIQEMVRHTTQRVIKRLSFYLLKSEYHIFHVLIRQTTTLVDDVVKDVRNILKSNICKQMFKDLYMHFLVLTPIKDTSDEAFCRAYILFENWKAFEDYKQNQKIEECIKNLFKRGVECIRDNKFLKKILQPQASIMTELIKVTSCNPNITKAYFDHIKSKQKADAEILDDIGKLALSEISYTFEELEDEDDDDARYRDLLTKMIGESNINLFSATNVVENSEAEDVKSSVLPTTTIQDDEVQIIICDSDSDSDLEIISITPGQNGISSRSDMPGVGQKFYTHRRTNCAESTQPKLSFLEGIAIDVDKSRRRKKAQSNSRDNSILNEKSEADTNSLPHVLNSTSSNLKTTTVGEPQYPKTTAGNTTEMDCSEAMKHPSCAQEKSELLQMDISSNTPQVNSIGTTVGSSTPRDIENSCGSQVNSIDTTICESPLMEEMEIIEDNHQINEVGTTTVVEPSIASQEQDLICVTDSTSSESNVAKDISDPANIVSDSVVCSNLSVDIDEDAEEMIKSEAILDNTSQPSNVLTADDSSFNKDTCETKDTESSKEPSLVAITSPQPDETIPPQLEQTEEVIPPETSAQLDEAVLPEPSHLCQQKESSIVEESSQINSSSDASNTPSSDETHANVENSHPNINTPVVQKGTEEGSSNRSTSEESDTSSQKEVSSNNEPVNMETPIIDSSISASEVSTQNSTSQLEQSMSKISIKSSTTQSDSQAKVNAVTLGVKNICIETAQKNETAIVKKNGLVAQEKTAPNNLIKVADEVEKPVRVNGSSSKSNVITPETKPKNTENSKIVNQVNSSSRLEEIQPKVADSCIECSQENQTPETTNVNLPSNTGRKNGQINQSNVLDTGQEFLSTQPLDTGQISRSETNLSGDQTVVLAQQQLPLNNSNPAEHILTEGTKVQMRKPDILEETCEFGYLTPPGSEKDVDKDVDEQAVPMYSVVPSRPYNDDNNSNDSATDSRLERSHNRLNGSKSVSISKSPIENLGVVSPETDDLDPSDETCLSEEEVEMENPTVSIEDDEFLARLSDEEKEMHNKAGNSIVKHEEIVKDAVGSQNSTDDEDERIPAGHASNPKKRKPDPFDLDEMEQFLKELDGSQYSSRGNKRAKHSPKDGAESTSRSTKISSKKPKKRVKIKDNPETIIVPSSSYSDSKDDASWNEQKPETNEPSEDSDSSATVVDETPSSDSDDTQLDRRRKRRGKSTAKQKMPSVSRYQTRNNGLNATVPLPKPPLKGILKRVERRHTYQPLHPVDDESTTFIFVRSPIPGRGKRGMVGSFIEKVRIFGKSFATYKISLNDFKLCQALAEVGCEKLTDNTQLVWDRVTRRTRGYICEEPFSQPDEPMYKIVFDKSTPHINSNDRKYFCEPPVSDESSALIKMQYNSLDTQTGGSPSPKSGKTHPRKVAEKRKNSSSNRNIETPKKKKEFPTTSSCEPERSDVMYHREECKPFEDSRNTSDSNAIVLRQTDSKEDDCNNAGSVQIHQEEEKRKSSRLRRHPKHLEDFFRSTSEKSISERKSAHQKQNDEITRSRTAKHLFGSRGSQEVGDS